MGAIGLSFVTLESYTPNPLTSPLELHSTGQMPEMYHDEAGRPYLRTKRGAKVTLQQDNLGNIYMTDPDGNTYYDTGDKRLGVYLVSA